LYEYGGLCGQNLTFLTILTNFGKFLPIVIYIALIQILISFYLKVKYSKINPIFVKKKLFKKMYLISPPLQRSIGLNT
jgi:hypothetical protein